MLRARRSVVAGVRLHVGHLVVGMKRGEMQRHVGPELLHDPAALGLDLVVGVVLAGNEERSDLEPHVRPVPEIHERVEHRREPRAALPEIELVGERLQVDVRRVHLRVELAPRRLVHVARGDRDGLDAARVARVGDVHRVLGEDHRVVVGERDAAAAARRRRFRDRRRRGFVRQAVHVARLGDIPVLAELAREVAARGAEGQDARAGIELVERLFLHRIDAESGGAAIGGEHHGVAVSLAHEAGAALAFVQPAIARAEIALHPAVGKQCHHRPG